MPDICCKNDWHDYTGGPDHHTIQEARECERDSEAREHHDGSHVVLIPLDEYERLIGGES